MTAGPPERKALPSSVIMPTTYTHERFGRDVLRRLPEELKPQTEAEYDLYRIGLQGPDIFFYYNPLFKNRINKVGSRIHRKPGRIFFEKAAKVLAEHDDPLAWAYVYGSLCHFALDAVCHNFIIRHEKETGISHAEIEGEFDRYLLEMDGKNPVAEDLSDGFRPTKRYAEIISKFYPGVTPRGVLKALKGFVTVNRILVCRTDLKRNLLTSLMKTAHVYKRFGGHIVRKEANPRLALSDDRLMELYMNTLPKAAQLIEEFSDTAKGRRSYDRLYSLTYESEMPVIVEEGES